MTTALGKTDARQQTKRLQRVQKGTDGSAVPAPLHSQVGNGNMALAGPEFIILAPQIRRDESCHRLVQQVAVGFRSRLSFADFFLEVVENLHLVPAPWPGILFLFSIFVDIIDDNRVRICRSCRRPHHAATLRDDRSDGARQMLREAPPVRAPPPLPSHSDMARAEG